MQKHSLGRPAGNSKNTKYDLMISAIKLFADNDFNAISIKDIAKSCGTTSAMVHYYFGSKDKLIDSIATDFSAPIYKDTLQKAIDKENPIDMVESVIDNIIALVIVHPYIARMWTKNFLYNDNNIRKYIMPHIPLDFINMFAAKIIKGQKDELINKDLLPKLVYPTILSNIFLSMNAFNFLLKDTNNEEKIKHIKSFILKGIKNG